MEDGELFYEYESIIREVLADYVNDSMSVDKIREYWSLCEITGLAKVYFLYYGRGYCISSFVDWGDTSFANVSGNIHKKSFSAEHEQEAILKACKWIIDIEDLEDLDNK